MDYRTKACHWFVDEEAGPFEGVGVVLYTLEMFWVETLTHQDMNFESDEWEEKEYQGFYFPQTLGFLIYLESDSLDRSAKEDLRFIYQDSTGTRKDGEIYSYELDETKKPEYMVKIQVVISLPSNPQNITWFSLHILNKNTAGRVDMRWDFRKD